MRLAGWFVTICVAFSVACSRPTIVEDSSHLQGGEIRPTPEATKPPIPIHIASFTSSQLCARLISVDTLPTWEPEITDPIYEGLIAKGDDAIPCLIEKISDTTPMPDPRYSVPHWQNFVVGDTAVFILLDIQSKRDWSIWERLMNENLPQKYKEEWKTNGIYTYFNYVSELKNRKELQRSWRKWLKENQK